MSELQTMQDALDIVKDIQIGDLVQGEVLFVILTCDFLLSATIHANIKFDFCAK